MKIFGNNNIIKYDLADLLELEGGPIFKFSPFHEMNK
jgi:hypothetical protein